jgi:hypothetical protein
VRQRGADMADKPTVETEDWPNLTHESRQELLKEIQAAGTDVTNKWLSQAAVETIRRLREQLAAETQRCAKVARVVALGRVQLGDMVGAAIADEVNRRIQEK